MTEPHAAPPTLYLSPAQKVGLNVARRVVQVLGRIAPGPVAQLCVRLFTTPRRHTPPVFEQEIATTAEHLQIDYAGKKLAALAWGTGPVVLLVHGWEGRGAQLGRFMPSLVAAGYRVVAVDGPAHGASEGTRTQVVDMAHSLNRVAAVVGPVHGIIAHSFGGAATLLAIEQGLRPARIVLIGVPVALAAVVGRFDAIFQLPPRLLQAFREALGREIGCRLEDANFARSPVPESVAGLLVHDRGDTEVPFEEGKALHDAWPAARFRATEGLGHRRILKDDAVIAEAVAFVDTAAVIEAGV